MAVYKYTKEITNKKTGKKVKKNAYRCIGSYVDYLGNPQNYHKRGFSTEREAKEWEREFLIEAKNPKDIGNKISFLDLYELYIKNRRLYVKEQVAKDIEYLCKKHILPYWQEYSLKNINIGEIKKWQEYLMGLTYYNRTKKENVVYSNKQLRNIQTQLKTILNYGSTIGMITDHQTLSWKLVKHPDEAKKEMLIWEPEEYNRFISSVDDPILHTLFNTLYWCGLRIGEALALNWNDINFNTKTISITKSYNSHSKKVTTPKTQNSYRNIIMTDKCFNSIKALYDIQKENYGFSNECYIFGFDEPLDDNYIRRKKDKYCEIAHVKNIRIHDFRHSHVSLLIDLDFPAFKIAKRLGHSVDMVNNTYGHLFNKAQNEMVDKLNKI